MAKPKTARNIEVPDDLLKELLTPSELRMLKNRWQITQALEDGLSIRQIAKQIKVGTDTVVRVARMVEKGNLQSKLTKYAKPKIKSSTPWIFGSDRS